jgi:predicted transcriptional regulator
MRRLKNITIAVEEDVARRARLLAAKRQTSVSRLLAETLSQIVNQDEEYERAMKRTLSRNLSLKSDGKYLSREEVHDRSRLR